jgi:hypothetical protein
MPPLSAFAVGFFESLRRLLDQPLPGLAPFPAEKFQLLVFQFVGRDEKFLDFGADLLGQVARVVIGLFAVRIARDRNETVIADRVFATLGLHDFEHADDLALEDKARGSRGIMQDQCVDGIAVFTLSLIRARLCCGCISTCASAAAPPTKERRKRRSTRKRPRSSSSRPSSQGSRPRLPRPRLLHRRPLATWSRSRRGVRAARLRRPRPLLHRLRLRQRRGRRAGKTAFLMFRKA